VQVAPLTAKAAAAGLAPVWCRSYEPKGHGRARGDRGRSSSRFVTVTWLPAWVAVADQAWVIRCPAV
jgi:hypothetical protein